MPKNIVLCSDGTGNTAILGRGTNVFKIYEAVDQHWSSAAIDSQVAFYGDGVGTESIKWLKLITGAFGVGLRRNVRELYAQLARVYVPGDQIYLFGFSRGAYTVRMLAWLIAEVGIVKSGLLAPGAPGSVAAQGEVEPAVSADMNQAANAAFSALRSRFSLLLFRPRDQSRVSHLTVPTPEIRKFWVDYPSWLPDGAEPDQRHQRSSHFNQDQRAMAAAAGMAANGVRIRFIGVWDTVDAYGFPVEEIAEFWDRFIYAYRFPDTYVSDIVDQACHALSIDDERATFAPIIWQARRKPVAGAGPPGPDPRVEQVWFAGVHANVGGGYPKQGMSLVTLSWMMAKAHQAGLQFIAHDRHFVEEHGHVHDKLYDSRSGPAAYYRYGPRDLAELCRKAGMVAPTLHASVLHRIQARTDEYAPAYVPGLYSVDRTGTNLPMPLETNIPDRVAKLEIVKDVHWWRLVIYYVLVGLTLSLVAFAWSVATDREFPDVHDWNGWSRGVYVALQPILATLDWITPNYVRTGVNGLRHHPLITLGFATALLSTYLLGARLLAQSRELGFRAWRGSLPSLKNPAMPAPIAQTPLLKFARWARFAAATNSLAFLTRCVMPFVVIVAAAVVVVAIFCRWLMPAFSVGLASTEPVVARVEGKTTWTFPFDTRHPLQPTPVLLERGEQYRIRVVTHTPWKDKSLDATPDGVIQPTPFMENFGAIRRDPRYPWFVLLGSIDTDPETIFPIGLGTLLRPDRPGRLYLFVNDVHGFYHNNQGTAEIRVERLSPAE